MNRPMISVIVPTFNRPEVLAEAIESVLNQTYRNLELVIVDDASTTDVKKIIDGFIDTRIRYTRHTTNRGVAAAKNTGIRMATGEYIGFLDDDDLYLGRKIEKQMEVLQESSSSVGLVYCGVTYVAEDGQFTGRMIPRHRDWPSMDRFNQVGVTALVKRDCFEAVGLFDEGLKCLEDWDMWLRMCSKFDSQFCPEPLYLARRPILTQQHLSGNLERMLESVEALYEKHTHDFESLPKKSRKRVLSSFHRLRAICYYDSNMIGKGKEEAVKSFLSTPIDAASWRLLIVGSFGPRVFHLLRRLRRSFTKRFLLQ